MSRDVVVLHSVPALGKQRQAALLSLRSADLHREFQVTQTTVRPCLGKRSENIVLFIMWHILMTSVLGKLSWEN